MHISKLLSTAFVSLALAIPISSRDAASIDTSITNIETKISTLNTTLNGFAPYQPTALLTVLKIQSQTNKLGDAISCATQTISASQPLDNDDSATVAQATVGLESQIFSLLNNIVSKKPAFDTAVFGIVSVSATVKQGLVKQKQLSAELGEALVSKLSGFFAGAAGSVNRDIADRFQGAMDAYGVSGGTIPLPPFPGF